MWTASAEQQFFSRSVGWLNRVWQQVQLGQGCPSPLVFYHRRQKNLSKSKHPPCNAPGTALSTLACPEAELATCSSRWIFLPGTKPSLSFTPCTTSRWTQHCQTGPALSPFHNRLSCRQTLLQPVTMTSLQCHSTPTVTPEPALALNLVQIFKVAITSYTSLLPSGDKLQIYTIPYLSFLKVIYCFAIPSASLTAEELISQMITVTVCVQLHPFPLTKSALRGSVAALTPGIADAGPWSWDSLEHAGGTVPRAPRARAQTCSLGWNQFSDLV